MFHSELVPVNRRAPWKPVTGALLGVTLISAWVLPNRVQSSAGGGSVPKGAMIVSETANPSPGYSFAGVLRDAAWTKMPPMPTPRYGHGAAWLQGALYAIGGYSFVSNTPVGTVESLDLSTDTWSVKSSMSASREYCAVAAVNGKLYAIGGKSAAGAIIDVVEEYDPATNAWTTKTPLPAPRAYAGASVVNGQIYVVGGYDVAYNVLTKLEAYDPVNDSWTILPLMPTARALLACASLNGVVYAIGGYLSSGRTSVVEAYDVNAGSWSSRASLPSARGESAAVALGGRIVVMGGSPAAASVLEYDPALDAWTMAAGLSEPMAGGHAAVTAADRIFALGGDSVGTVQHSPGPILYLHRRN